MTDKLLRKGFRIACERDILFFVNVFVLQFNPRKKGKVQVGAFATWGFQDDALLEMLRCIEEDEDLCIEKSREMGASWMLVIVFVWLWLFQGWSKFLLISRNAEAVESDDPDSLLWKFDFIVEHLPDWLRPRIKGKKMYRGNLDNRAVVTGQASTGKAGVGGRATAMGIDEFSQIEEDFEVLHRTSDTTGCRIFNFTHTGLHTAAYEIAQRADMRKLVLHWTQHPEKIAGLYRYDPAEGKVEVLDKSYKFPEDFRFVMDGSPTGGPFPGVRSPWYDDQCRRKGSARAVAMDLDIDPKGSVSQFFDRLLILQLQTAYCREPDWEGDLHYDHENGQPFALEPRKGGPVRIWGRLHNGLPKPDFYGMGADCATGTGATPSCLSIMRGSTGEKVLEYANPFILPEKFAVLCVALARLYKNPAGEGGLLCWEVPGPGYTFGNRVLELGYSPIHYRTSDIERFAVASDKPGWAATPTSKRFLLEEYRAALSSRQCLNRSKNALADCLAFKYDRRGMVEHGAAETTNDPSGARVNHADAVIADALAWKMAKSFGLSANQQKAVEERAPPIQSLLGRRQLAARVAREEVWS